MKTISLKNLLLATLLITLTGNVVFAKTRLYCSSKYKAGKRGCFFKHMRLYNQRKVSDNHCAPTSAAMGLSAITFGGLSYYTNSWTKRNFINKSEVQRIRNFGRYMDTSYRNGTSGSNIRDFSSRQSDIVNASSNVDWPSYTTLNDSRIKTLIRRGEVDILTYGHYIESCRGVGSTKICEYDRDGGHVVAINGYYRNNTTHIFDPWEAREKNRNIRTLPNRTRETSWYSFGLSRIDNRPYGSRTQYLLQDGNQVKIIDGLNGIDTDS